MGSKEPTPIPKGSKRPSPPPGPPDVAANNPHYFDQEEADPTDHALKMCIHQGYVPASCLLAGMLVLGIIALGDDPCTGCNCDREKCKGRPKKQEGLING